MKKILLTTTLFSLLFACQEPVTDPDALSAEFGAPTANVLQPNNILSEASGLADSQKQAGLLWSHEDAGSGNYLFLVNRQGTVLGSMEVPIINYDWEDIAVGPGPQNKESYIYLADIGDNGNTRDIKQIYRFVEPSKLDEAVSKVDVIQFRYPDGSFDAEAMLLDPLTRDLFIVTKWTTMGQVYRLPYPQSTTEIKTAEKVGNLTVGGDLTGGAVSVTGREIIVRGYTALYYWRRTAEQTVGEVLKQNPLKTLPYTPEPQGEAVCFDKDGKGYFTLSERRLGAPVNLYFFPRK